MIGFRFKCPLCGSTCFGSSYAHTSDGEVMCHSTDDPEVERKRRQGELSCDFVCDYSAPYSDMRHWVPDPNPPPDVVVGTVTMNVPSRWKRFWLRAVRLLGFLME